LSKLSELAAEFAELTKVIDSRSADTKAAKAERAKVETQLYEEMCDEGCQNYKVTDGPNLYRRIDKFYGPAKGVTKEELMDELAAHPQTMLLVKRDFNIGSLRSTLNEIEAHGDEIPPELAAKLSLFEKYRIGHRS